MPADLDARARRFEREERARWETKYAKKKQENDRLREKLARVLKHQKLLETTLVTQQQVLDRYHRELAAHRSQAAPKEARDSAPDNKIRVAVDVPTGDVDVRAVKRAKREGVVQRHSMPLTDYPTTDESGVPSSASRRRSLPETNQRTNTRGENAGNRDVWTTRKQDMDGHPTAPISATALLRPRLSVRSSSSLANRQDNARYSAEDKGEVSDSVDEFLNDYDAAGNDDKKSRVVKSEPKREERGPLQERETSERPVRPPYQRRDLPFKSHASSVKPEQPPRTHAAEKENAFAYVEVVRNRAERAALPGHDCIECRKYYAALDGLVPKHEMKDKCSRHRARFEPYQTPDDFWRLSFPDSHSESMASP